MWVSGMGISIDKAAYVDRETGKVYLVSEEWGDSEEELPEDLEDNPRYVMVPDKRELDLGTALVARFAREQMPESEGEIREFFRRKGAYARLKDFLEREGKLEDWYAYEAAAEEAALRDWAEAEGFAVVSGVE